MPQAVIDIILPLFAIMLAGYMAGRTGVMSEAGSEVLNRFVFSVSFPALVFVALSRVNVAEFFNWPFLAVLGGGMLATFCLAVLLARFVFPGRLTALALHGLTAMFSSTAYIGVPLILIAFGNEALVPAIIGAVITGLVFFPLAVVLAEIEKGREAGNLLFGPVKSIICNPVLIATAAGLMVSALGISLPKPVIVFCDLLGGAFIPCALFSAGLFLVGCSLKGDVGEVSWLVFVKLAVHPAITWYLAYYVISLDAQLAAIAVLQAALPTGVPVFILAQQYGVFVARATATVAITTALSLVTLSLILTMVI